MIELELTWMIQSCELIRAKFLAVGVEIAWETMRPIGPIDSIGPISSIGPIGPIWKVATF